jgi:hypothetical protein
MVGGLQKGRPGGFAPCTPTKDKTLEPLNLVGGKGGGHSNLPTHALAPSFSPDQVMGSGDLSPAGSRGRAPGLPS